VRTSRSLWMNVAHYLDQLGKELATRGATSAQVASIEFNHDTDEIRVHVSESARVASYPDLAKVLERIGRLCLSDRVPIRRLRSIVFCEQGISLKLAGRKDRATVLSLPVKLRVLDG
jgi:hypothetical protein